MNLPDDKVADQCACESRDIEKKGFGYRKLQLHNVSFYSKAILTRYWCNGDINLS